MVGSHNTHLSGVSDCLIWSSTIACRGMCPFRLTGSNKFYPIQGQWCHNHSPQTTVAPEYSHCVDSNFHKDFFVALLFESSCFAFNIGGFLKGSLFWRWWGMSTCTGSFGFPCMFRNSLRTASVHQILSLRVLLNRGNQCKCVGLILSMKLTWQLPSTQCICPRSPCRPTQFLCYIITCFYYYSSNIFQMFSI